MQRSTCRTGLAEQASHHLDFKLGRTWVEARWQPLLARAVTTIEHTLQAPDGALTPWIRSR
jgi:hypothetical protein